MNSRNNERVMINNTIANALNCTVNRENQDFHTLLERQKKLNFRRTFFDCKHEDHINNTNNDNNNDPGAHSCLISIS